MVIFLEIRISERCLLGTGLYFVGSFTVSKKISWLLDSKASRCPRKGRSCLIKNNMTSTTLSKVAYLFFCFSSICFCMFLSIVCCSCSLIASCFHFSMHSLWVSKFSCSNMRGFKCQKLLKYFVTNKALPVKWNDLQQKQYNPDYFFEYNNHLLKILSQFLSIF